MADPVLHIKDSFYFEVPKPLARAHFQGKDFPGVWVKNDDQFQQWEAERLYHELHELAGSEIKLPDEHGLIHDWQHWQHEGHNHGRPFSLYLDSLLASDQAGYQKHLQTLKAGDKPPTFAEYVSEQSKTAPQEVWFSQLHEKIGAQRWTQLKREAHNKEAIEQFKKDDAIQWSEKKVAAYNDHLSGKILLYPQPFGDLRNMYEPEYGFNISKLMVVEVLVGILLFVVFGWVAARIRSGAPPKGRLWNLLEVFLLFIRDQIARPALGGHHDEHEAEHAHSDPTGVKEGHAIGGAGLGGAPAEVDHPHDHPADPHRKAHKQHGHHHNPYADADRFVPLLWTIFFFVLSCNLFGLIPWLGGPTATFGVTFALALSTFIVVCISGMAKFGVLGFFANQVPSMDLPIVLAVVLKPMIFAIELLGLLIKHLVLSIRLLANMVAGHLVILGILAVAFSAEAALTFSPESGNGWLWWIAAPIAIVSATVFNILELFVAFLQAYIFTFLTALFIGASVHKH